MIGILALLAAASTTSSGLEPERHVVGPLELQLQREGDGFVVEVTGQSERQATISFDLTLDSGTGGNRIRQSGGGELRAGVPQSFARLRMSGLRLCGEVEVRIADGERYEGSFCSVAE